MLYVFKEGNEAMKKELREIQIISNQIEEINKEMEKGNQTNYETEKYNSKKEKLTIRFKVRI